MSAPPGAEGEEGEVVEEAEVSIMEAAMAKEVKTDPGILVLLVDLVSVLDTVLNLLKIKLMSSS